MIDHMKTISWPAELTQTYVNVNIPDRTITIDDDHQAVGKHSAQCGPSGARELAAAHRAVADALDAAADAIGGALAQQAAQAPVQAGEEGA